MITADMALIQTDRNSSLTGMDNRKRQFSCLIIIHRKNQYFP